ncbi:hypothetical protein J2W32_000963 [Variovorax boronicumulans]|uniref:Uncharacterized protein n=1 Tax=Variovorax boronicumulans TaxID=436515 RepID=A0AAW8CXY3_9BURK|nr:hypothetical protein [Variovorax boronicumulans]MDP9892593.1 hypothetical protein [Variovorax boronicumulans]MDQ0051927.1 hypothetical protein [Variovorax boronicumulans]
MALEVHTEWDTPIDGSAPDLAKHEAFADFALSLIRHESPWLYRFLNGANAQVLVGVGICAFSMPATPGIWFELDQMAEQINLLPWAEPHEVRH